MNILKSISIKNVVTFKEATLPLNKHPCIVIRGKNLDVKAKDPANGAGKSLLLSSIPMLRYEAPPTANRKKSIRDMHDKGSNITLVGQSFSGRKFSASQHQKAKTVGYTIIENGKDLKYRTSAEATKHLERLLPITREQFYSFVYLDALHTPAIVNGTAAERNTFFEKAFRLDVFDKIAAKVNKQYNVLKLELQRLKELEREVEDTKGNLPKESLKELNKHRKALVEKAAKVRSRVGRDLKTIQSLTAYMTLSEGLPESATMAKVKERLKEEEDDLKGITKQWQDAIRAHEAAEAHKEAREKAHKYRERIKTVVEHIASLSTKAGVRPDLSDVPPNEEFVERIADLTREAKRLETEQSLYDDYQKQLKVYYLFPAFKDRIAKTNEAKTTKRLEKARSTISVCEEALSTLEHAHDGDKCPTCFSPLSAKARKRLILTCRKDLEAGRAAVKEAKSDLEYFAILASLEKLAFDPERLVKTQKRIERMTKRLKVIKMLREYHNIHDNLKQRLADLPLSATETKKKTRLDIVAPPHVIEDTMKGCEKRVRKLRAIKDRLTKIEALGLPYTSFAEAKEQHDNLRVKIDKYQPMLESLQDALQDATIKTTKAEGLAESIATLIAKIAKHKESSAQYKVYEALREAFGAKGLRRLRVAQIAAHYEQNLNEYASTLFGEPIKFKIVLGNAKFDILAARNNKAATDVRTLSGSEKRKFILLSALALLPLVPPSARCNLLVLDEMESNMDAPSQHMLVNNFIPMLNSLIPNVVVITPKSEKDFYLPNAVSYTVVKKNGVSRLEAN